tara:strand:- start:1435 stop:2049 length:615 start_codon:yes stop_codon:yes gene_type:complete
MENSVEGNDTYILSVKPPKKNDGDELPGYEKETVENLPETTKECSVCWNCTLDIKNEVNMPIKYERGSFYVYGHFCCTECVARYLIDNYHNQGLWEKYVLLNYYSNIMNDTTDVRVLPCPDKRMLKKFGGIMTYEEYHSESSNGFSDIALPPIFPVSHTVHGNDPRTKGGHYDNTSDLRLFRKKAVKKNTIISKMNINQGTHMT